MLKKLLLALIATTAVANSPMIWDSAEYGKMLTSLGFKLQDEKQYRTLTVDPSITGVTAAVGSLGVRNNGGVGELWVKTGAGDTAWSQLSSGAGVFVLKAGDTMTGPLRVNSTITALSDIQAGLAGVSSGTLVTCTVSGSNCGSFAQVTNGESRLVGPAALSMYSGGNERLSFSSGGVPSVQLPYSWPFAVRAGDTMSGSLGLNYASVTPDRAAYVDGSRVIRTSTTVSSQELEYLDGLTANIQAQLNAAGSGAFVLKSGDTMTGTLVMDAGTAIQVGNINNTSGATAMNVDAIQLYDASSVLSVDGQSRSLKSLAGDQKFNWDTGVYSHDNGVTMLDAERGLLGSFGLTGVTSLSWTTRELFSSNGSPVAQWGTGVGGIDIDLDGGTITSVPTPVNATDAVNKQYVDDAIAGVSIPDGTFVRITGDTMTGNLGTQQVRLPFGTSPGSILYGDDTDTGPFQTGDGEYYIAANGFNRLHISQNYSEFLGPVTVTGDLNVGGNINFAAQNDNQVFAGPATGGPSTPSFRALVASDIPVIDISSGNTGTTGVLGMGQGGTGRNGYTDGAIPFKNPGVAEFTEDNAAFSFTASNRRLNISDLFINQIHDGTSTSPGAVGGEILGVTGAINSDVYRVQQSLSGTFGYVQGPSYLTQLNGVSTSLVIGHGMTMAVNSGSRIGLFKGDDIGPSFSTDSRVDTLEVRTTTPGLRGSIGNLTLDKVAPNVNPGELQEITGAVFGRDTVLSGITSNTSIVAGRYSVSNSVVTAPFVRPLAAVYEGPIQGVATVTHQPGNPNGVDQVSLLVANVVVDDPSSTPIIGLSSPLNLSVNENISGTGLGFGATSTAYVGLLGITSGVTVESVGGNIAAIVNTLTSTGGTGGHAGRVFGYRPKGLIPGGGSNTFGDVAGFWFGSGDCSGVSPCYSLASEDANATVYSAGPLKLGLTPDTVPYLDGATTLVSSSVTGTELEYLSGVSLPIQSQIASLQGVTSGTFVRKSGDTMTGALSVPLGSATAPTVAFNGDPDSGLYSPSANNVSVAVSGVQTLNVSTAGSTFSSALSVTNTGSSSITSSGSIRAAQDIFIGQSGSGSGGKIRGIADSGSEFHRIGYGGSAGATDWEHRSIPLGAVIMAVSTAGQTTYNYPLKMKAGLTNVGGTMYTQIAGVTVANTTTETTLMGASVGTRTIPANTLTAGDTIVGTFGGLIGCTSTPNLVMRFKANSTNHIAQTVTPAVIDMGGDTENYCDNSLKIFNAEVVCTVRTTGASGTLFCAGGSIELFANNKGGGKVNFGASSSSTIDTTTSQVLDLTGQWDTSDVNNQVQIHTAVIEVK